VLHNTLLRNP